MRNGPLAAGALLLCGLASLAIWASVPPLGPLRGPALLRYLPLYLAAFAVYLGAIAILWRSRLASYRPAMRVIFLIAVLIRLPLLLQPPTLSDDVYRYIWDGRVGNAGVSPYAYRVDSPALDGLATPARARVNNPDMASPYLPVAQVLFAAVYRLAPESAAAFQIAAMTFDLVAGLFIMLALRRLDRPGEWVLVYLWNPLVVVEFAHGAHVDALMVMLMTASLLLALGGRRAAGQSRPAAAPLGRLPPLLSPVLLALATLVKPVPALLLPALAPRWGWRRTAIYGAAVVAGLLPYAGAGLGLSTPLAAGTGLFGAARIYLARWNFNGGLYHWLEVWVTGYPTAGAVPAGTPGIETAKALSGAALLVVLGIVFWQALKMDSPGLWLVPIAAYLLLAPTVHPWYLAPLVALLPLSIARAAQADVIRAAPWLYISASAALSYLTYLDPLNLRETEFVRRWEYLPLYGLLIVAALWPRRAGAIAASR